MKWQQPLFHRMTSNLLQTHDSSSSDICLKFQRALSSSDPLGISTVVSGLSDHSQETLHLSGTYQLSVWESGFPQEALLESPRVSENDSVPDIHFLLKNKLSDIFTVMLFFISYRFGLGWCRNGRSQSLLSCSVHKCLPRVRLLLGHVSEEKGWG